jgi:hypothetical protein
MGSSALLTLAATVLWVPALWLLVLFTLLLADAAVQSGHGRTAALTVLCAILGAYLGTQLLHLAGWAW